MITRPSLLFLCLISGVLLEAGRTSCRSAESSEGNDPLATGIFGIGACHINSRSVEDFQRWMPQMEEIGLRYYRSPATAWHMLEPEEGHWQWKELDGQLDFLKRHGFITGGLFLASPGWNKLDKPGSLPVNNLVAWKNYVSQTVRHCKGSIRRWEVWNEPPNFTGRDQTPADYAKIVMAAYEAAKAEDPGCAVGLAAKSAHITYLEQVIRAGAKDHFDWISLHPYEILDGVAANSGMEPIFLNIVPSLRKMLASANPARANVPVIFTELGCDLKKGADTQAHSLVKAYVMGIAQGVACIEWFEGRDGDSGPMGLLDAQGKSRPAYQAMSQLIRHFGQQPTCLGWVILNKIHPAFVFQGKSGPVMAAWTPEDGSEIAFDSTVSISDTLTGTMRRAQKLTLTKAPVIVADLPRNLVEEAAQNRSRHIPWWGPDRTKATSVSLTFDPKFDSQGLRTLSGDAVAQAVVAYGGSARSGDVPGGGLFVVDPSFLSYTAEPLEVTVVCRRKEANANAGFKLVYESPKGFSTAGTWYTIPDNKQWHTATFRIDDPQFVNYWGYNFVLESDGNQYNKYYLKSVTVKRITDAGQKRPKVE